MALKTDYGNVRTMVAIENPMVRRGAMGLLNQIGFKNIIELSNFVKIHQIVNDEEVDLIIANSDMSDFFVGQILKEMRINLKSITTFAITVLLSQHADHDYLRKVIDCGPDDVILMPFSPQQLIDRVKNFTERRKPFIVTFNYVGPDRRKQARHDGSEEIPLVEVPNLLQARARLGSSPNLKENAEKALQRLTMLRIQRCGVQIRWLCDAIRKLILANKHDAPELTEHMNGIAATCQDLKMRTADWTNERMQALIAESETAVSAALANYARLDIRQVERTIDVAGKVSAEITRVFSN